MITWLVNYPILLGLITYVLMQCDWLLTLAQEKERAQHYFEHYQSYPLNTIEGNAALQRAVKNQKLFEPRHFTIALLSGIATGLFVPWIDEAVKYPVLGFIWGIFLLVNAQHVSNWLGYRAGRRGLHGKLYLHQRTALLTQAGRYLATALLFLVMFVLSASTFLLGVALAGFVSAARQLQWYRKVPRIAEDDYPPVGA
jgi:hypothetical protein